jgi:integrase
MPEQQDFQFRSTHFNRLTIEEGLFLLWKYHLGSKPSGRTYNGSRIAWCKSSGRIFMDDMNGLDVSRHLLNREFGSRPVNGQTRLHDINLLNILYNQVRRWKRNKYKLDGFDCATLSLPPENPTIDIERPKTSPRYYMVPPNDLAKFMEHSSQRLRNILCFLIDTAMSECDLRKMKTSDCNPTDRSVYFVRQKTQRKVNKIRVIPLSNRCWEIVIDAYKKGLDNPLDFTGHEIEFYRTRLRCRVYFQKRDLRKTNSNIIAREFSISDASRILTHQSQRTTVDHYIIPDNSDLRPKIQHVSNMFGGKNSFSDEEKTIENSVDMKQGTLI